MASRELSYNLYVDWAGDNSYSFNESNYLLSASGNDEMSNPNESVYSGNGYASEASFTLFNKGFRFSPSGSPVLASGGIKEHIQNGKFYGKKVRFYVVIDGDSELVFQGGIKEITENPRTTSNPGTVTLSCNSEDAFIINQKLNTPNSDTKSYFETGKDEGELIARTLTLAGLADGVHFISQSYGGGGTPTIDRGMFTIPWYWLDSESPVEDCWKLAAACCGRFYYNTEDGKYYYKNAQFLGFAPSSIVQETLSESNCDRVTPIYKDKELYKSVKVTIRPRQIGQKTVMWEPDEVIRILPGETINLSAKLNAPVYEYTELKLKVTNTGGFDITDDMSIASPTYFTQSVDFQITNNGAYHGFIRQFQLIGRPLEGGETSFYERESSDTTYWSGRQGKERKISENPYLQTLAQGEAIANMLAQRQGYFNEEFSVEGYRGINILRVAWRVRLINSSISLDKEAIVTSVNWKLDASGFSQDLKGIAGSNLYQYTPGDYFIIGTHSGSSSKRYFY